MPSLPLSPWTRLHLFLQRLARRKPPVVVISSCYALLQITADPANCDHCGKCSRACPMNIDLLAYIDGIQRDRSTDCILCQSCVNACTENVLSVTSALDDPRRPAPR